MTRWVIKMVIFSVVLQANKLVEVDRFEDIDICKRSYKALCNENPDKTFVIDLDD